MTNKIGIEYVDYLTPTRVLIVSDIDVQVKVIKHALRNIQNLYIENINDKIKALSYIFIKNPTVIIVFFSEDKESLNFCSLVRNNSDFENTPIIVILNKKLSIFKKIKMKSIKINDFLLIPINQLLLEKKIRNYIDKKQQ